MELRRGEDIDTPDLLTPHNTGLITRSERQEIPAADTISHYIAQLALNPGSSVLLLRSPA